jgi:hypothetical protein
MIEVQARLSPLAGFPSSVRSARGGLISPKRETTPKSVTSNHEPSVGDESTIEGDSSTESVYSYMESRTSDPANMEHNLCESDSGDDDFFSSDHSNMPSTREPSPEPFWDTAKRYGWRAEDIFAQRKMFQTPESPIPVEHFSSHLQPSSVQSNHTQYLAQFIGQEVYFKSTVESKISNRMDDVSANQPTPSCFVEMQDKSRKLGRKTSWLRVVHRGYGQIAWRNELQNKKLTVVCGLLASEGDYVLIPDGLCAQNIVDMMTEINQMVRKIVWFKEMKRANKSRLLFKWAPFSVSPSGDAMPIFAETNAFRVKD